MGENSYNYKNTDPTYSAAYLASDGILSYWRNTAEEYKKENAQLKAQLGIAKEALEEIEHGEEYDPLDEKHWYMDRHDMQLKAQQALSELETTGK